jgi:hypothetical protein
MVGTATVEELQQAIDRLSPAERMEFYRTCLATHGRSDGTPRRACSTSLDGFCQSSRRLVLRQHPEPLDVEAQFFLNGEFIIGRRPDARLGPTRPPPELAIAWVAGVAQGMSKIARREPLGFRLIGASSVTLRLPFIRVLFSS